MKKFVLAAAMLGALSVSAFAEDPAKALGVGEIKCTPGNLGAIEKTIDVHTNPAEPEQFGTAKAAIANARKAYEANDQTKCAEQLGLAAESVKTVMLRK